jgi:secondary thiamine-phosphate synthase enzyme
MIELPLQSNAKIQAIDITDLVTQREWPDGLLWLSCPHTTAGLVIGEGDDDMLADYERVAGELFEPYEPFRHHKNDNPNAAAHLVSSISGTQLMLAVSAGQVVFGTYQRIIFLELDGPKARRIHAVSIPALVEQEG